MPNGYYKWVQRDVEPEKPRILTPREKRKNWWDYHKWLVLLAVAVIGITIYLILGAFGVGKVHPDYQIAYVGSNELPADTAEALVTELESLGEDLNGDGEVVITLHQYCADKTADTQDDTQAMKQYASEVELIADLSECDSYFFLLEDPEQFQKTYQSLAMPDGSCPGEFDFSWEDKVYLWSDCPVLAELDLGTYSETVLGQTATGESQFVLNGLYFGRRCFYEENKNMVEYIEGCEAFWERLTEGAAT